MISEDAALREQVATAVRLLTAEGIMDFNGHLSVRAPDAPDQILINPRRISRNAVLAKEIVRVDLRNRPVKDELEPPSETPLHTAIYRQRADVMSVAHIHPMIATAFSIAQVPIVPVFTLGCIFGDGVPVFNKPDLIRSDQLADELAESLGNARAALMYGHGAVVVGENVEACFNACIWFEENAKKLLAARQMNGAIKPFTPEEIARLKKQMWQPEVLRKTWDYYVDKGKRAGVLD
jgi:ribulose-5-phosphate 4-epimerase/fuculose-1-phosphate aldolase